MSEYTVPTPAEHRDGTIEKLADGDVFSVDGGTTWHAYAVVQFGTVAVYAGFSRGRYAPTVRIDAARDATCLVGVQRITDPHTQRATVDDEVGRICIWFRNAINGRRIRRHRPDLAAARRLIAHFRPFNNTDYSADIVVDTDGIRTVTKAIELRVDRRFVFCRCFNDDENTCTKAEELADVIGT